MRSVHLNFPHPLKELEGCTILFNPTTDSNPFNPKPKTEVPTNTLFSSAQYFLAFFSIQPVTKNDFCDQILISLNFSLPNSIEFGAKQWRVVVGVHKLSDKKIAPTFLGWGGFSHQVWGDGKKFQKKTSFIFFHHRIQNHQIRSF